MSFSRGLRGEFAFLEPPNAYINQPMSPMNMSAGKSMMTSPLLRLHFRITNLSPGYHLAELQISFDSQEYRLRQQLKREFTEKGKK